MSSTRSDHTAIRLAGGRVLVVGGQNEALWHATAEAYDPATRRWAPAGRLAGVRANHARRSSRTGRCSSPGVGHHPPADPGGAVRPHQQPVGAGPALSAGRIAPLLTSLAGGQLLLTGGVGFVRRDYGLVALALPATERLDPGTGQWVAGAEMAGGACCTRRRCCPGAGAGGRGAAGRRRLPGLRRALRSRHRRLDGDAPLSRARASHTAVLLPGGQVLVAGGRTAGRVAGVEVYDPATNRWSAGP